MNRLPTSTLVIAVILWVGILTANIYDKKNTLPAADQILFDASYTVFQSGDYDPITQRTIEVSVAHPELVPSYSYNILEGVYMAVNPCIYDLEYCKKQNKAVLIDNPIIEASMLVCTDDRR